MKAIKNLVASFAFVMLLCVMFSTKTYAADATPLKVTGLKQVSATDTRVDFSWDMAVGCEENYYIIQKSTDGVSWTADNKSNSGCSGSIYGLSNDMAFYVRVAAYSGYSWSEGSVIGEYSDPLLVITNPSNVKGVTQVNATTNSVGLAWTPVEGAAYYQVALAQEGFPVVTTTTEPSVVIGGLAPSSRLVYTVAAVKQSPSGFVACGRYEGYSWYDQSVEVKTSPAQLTKDNIGIRSIYSGLRQLQFACNKPENVDGIQYEIRNVNKNKKVLSKAGTTAYCDFDYKTNVAYKYRARAYVEIAGQKVYGAWSPYRYFYSGNVSSVRKGNTITVGIKKNKNIAKATVYISKNEKGGYKKVKVLSGKKNSVVIKKCGKQKIKKGTYYLKVTYTIKDGKKTHVSDIITTITQL